jgi:hypothetical protein
MSGGRFRSPAPSESFPGTRAFRVPEMCSLQPGNVRNVFFSRTRTTPQSRSSFIKVVSLTNAPMTSGSQKTRRIR